MSVVPFPLSGARGRARPAPAFADAASAERRLAVYRYLVHVTGDRALAEDLTQETFEHGLRAWASYDARRGTPTSWLLAIARRVHLDHLRAERRRRGREARYAALEDPASAPPEGPSELSPALRTALSGLSASEREILALRVVLGLTGGEAASVLGISPSACSTALHRAMTRLRAEVSRDA